MRESVLSHYYLPTEYGHHRDSSRCTKTGLVGRTHDTRMALRDEAVQERASIWNANHTLRLGPRCMTLLPISPRYKSTVTSRLWAGPSRVSRPYLWSNNMRPARVLAQHRSKAFSPLRTPPPVLSIQQRREWDNVWVV